MRHVFKAQGGAHRMSGSQDGDAVTRGAGWDSDSCAWCGGHMVDTPCVDDASNELGQL